jgi:filamentous hemagglutinin
LNGATIQAGRDLILLVAKDKITDIVKMKVILSSAVWQDKGVNHETAKLPSFNGPSIPVFGQVG